MTPGLSDTLSLIFYLFFWMAIFTMVDWTLSSVWGLVLFSWTVVIICGAIASYVTVFLAKLES
jgi:hypothetical protein